MKSWAFILMLLNTSGGFAQSALLCPDFQQKLEHYYENDLFARTDRYYSQGIFLNYSMESRQQDQFRSKPVESYFNFQLIHLVYTPSTIRSDSALFNDRPYAATFSFYAGKTWVDRLRNRAFTIGFELGGVGPFAFGEQMQTAIHKATNNVLPLGWRYQVSNGFIFDVCLKPEFQLISKGWLNLNAGVDLEFGSFRTHLKPNVLIGLGNMDLKRNFFYSKSTLSLVGYDGTLQGSLIGRESMVIVPKAEIERIVFLQEFGLRFGSERLRFGLNYSMQSKTFSKQSGAFHSWGGITIGYQI